MSFRLFIYYCALCGGWAAFIAVFLGLLAPDDPTVTDYLRPTGIRGLFLGMTIAVGLGLVDAIFVLGGRRIGQVLLRVGTAVVLGCIGGTVGGMLGQYLYFKSESAFFFVFGWTFTGLLVGTSVGFFEVLANVIAEKNLSGGSKTLLLLVPLLGTSLGAILGIVAFAIGSGNTAGILAIIAAVILVIAIAAALLLSVVAVSPEIGKDFRSSRAKLLKCLLGGTIGGVLGGVIALVIMTIWSGLFKVANFNDLLGWKATGFVALGMCIGLLVGMAQVILKEAWIKVEAGFRPGRELILAKEFTTIGRGEGCDLGLFDDMECEKLHARIVLAGHQYYLEDAGAAGGTYLNDQRINGRAPLRGGDLIRVGKSLVRFRERQKRNK